MKLLNNIHLVGSGVQGVGISHDTDCHIYLLDGGGGELALIDAGGGMDVPAILRNIEQDGFDPADVKHLILTHAHFDHAGGAAGLREALGGPATYLYKDVAAFLADGDEEAINLNKAKQVGLFPPDVCYHACPVDVSYDEGATIKVGCLSLRVIHTPGHCQGHCSFLLEHEGQTIFFGGDLVFFGGKILLQNIWDCDLQAHLASIEKFRGAGIDVFLPGHLTFSLRNGQRHIDAALKVIDQLLVPPNFAYAW